MSKCLVTWRSIFRDEIGHAPELEVQVGVLSARSQCLAQELFDHRRVDPGQRVRCQTVS